MLRRRKNQKDLKGKSEFGLIISFAIVAVTHSLGGLASTPALAVSR